MARYSKALTESTELLHKPKMPFLTAYAEKYSGDFNPDKKYLISKTKAMKLKSGSIDLLANENLDDED
jgi:hypothetical protein